MKHLFLLLALTAFFISSKIYSQGPNYSPLPSCMLTNVLDVTTGKNHQINDYYTSPGSGCKKDGYWSVTSTDDGQTTPMCATVFEPYAVPPPYNGSNWRSLGVKCDYEVKNNTFVLV